MPSTTHGQGPGPGGVGAVVGVERAQGSGHRVHRQVEPAEGQQGQVGRGDRDDHAQGGLEPDVGGPAEAQHARQRESPGGRGGGGGGRTAHDASLAGVLPVKISSLSLACSVACSPCTPLRSLARRMARASLDRPSSGEVGVHGPASSGWLLVALCAATGAYCLLRMRSGVEEQRRAAGGEALMGFGMAAMAVPAAVFTPPAWAWPVYAAVFGGGGAARAVGGAGEHATICTTWWAPRPWSTWRWSWPLPRTRHGRGAGVPLLTGALLLYFAGLRPAVRASVWCRSPPGGRRPCGGGATGRNWRARAGCRWGSRWWRCC